MTLYIKTPHQIRKSNNESESRGSKPVATKQTASKATEALQGSEYQKFMKIVSSSALLHMQNIQTHTLTCTPIHMIIHYSVVMYVQYMQQYAVNVTSLK